MSKNQVFHIFLILKFWELICQILMSRGEAHKNTEKFAIFIQCHINIVKLNTFIKLFSATNILK